MCLGGLQAVFDHVAFAKEAGSSIDVEQMWLGLEVELSLKQKSTQVV